MKIYDCIIIGGGASGMSAAAEITKNSKSCAILDMGGAPGRKIRVSGGGRCNFTNMAASVKTYFGKNPKFVQSALTQVKPTDILGWAREHNLSWVEKNQGQYFCADGAEKFLSKMMDDIKGVDIFLETTVMNAEFEKDIFIINTNKSKFYSKTLIIATGGISYPTLTVSDIGYKLAKDFGHKIIPPTPALVGLKTDLFSTDLSGVSLPVEIKIGKNIISDSLLFTHFGIGGPAAYRTSLYSISDYDFNINFLPNINVYDLLTNAKNTNGKKSISGFLSGLLPNAFIRWLISDNSRNIADYKNSEILEIANKINNFVIPKNTLKRRGLNSAEVILGGVSTENISSKTFESKLQPGLYFAGEVIDIAGDLGGFNLHFAFASGKIAGKSVNNYLDLE